MQTEFKIHVKTAVVIDTFIEFIKRLSFIVFGLCHTIGTLVSLNRPTTDDGKFGMSRTMGDCRHNFSTQLISVKSCKNIPHLFINALNVAKIHIKILC